MQLTGLSLAAGFGQQTLEDCKIRKTEGAGGMNSSQKREAGRGILRFSLQGHSPGLDVREPTRKRNPEITDPLTETAARHHSPCWLPGRICCKTMASYFSQASQAAVTSRGLPCCHTAPGRASGTPHVPRPVVPTGQPSLDPFLPELSQGALQRLLCCFHFTLGGGGNPVKVIW